MTKKSYQPKYRQIFEHIRANIYNKIWHYGDKLPTIDEFCREFSVSRITMKKVFSQLKEAGLVRTVRHSGTFVVWTREKEYYQQPSGKWKRTVKIYHLMRAPLPLHEHVMMQLADSFMQHNPHVEICLSKTFPEQDEDPYLMHGNSDDLPTCGEFYWHARYAKENILYPLDTLPDFANFQKTLSPQAYYLTRNGQGEEHIHAAYLHLDFPAFLLCNTELLEKYGLGGQETVDTWEHLSNTIHTLAGQLSHTMYAVTLAMPQAYHGVKFFCEIMGQDIFGENYLANSPSSFFRIFDTESAVLALEHLRHIADSDAVRFKQGAEFFSLGQVAILPNANVWSLNLLNIINPRMNYKAIPLPPLGKNRYYRPFCAGFNVGIFRKASNSQRQLMAAWEWLQFLFLRRSQYLLTEPLKLPAGKDVTSYMESQLPLLGSLAKLLLSRAIPQPDFVGQRRAFTIAGTKIAALLQKQTTPEKCLRDIKDSLKHLLQP